MACGAQLDPSCPACGARALPEARFCGACGTALSETDPRSPAAPSSPASARVAGMPQAGGPRAAARGGAREERRTVTVLFADLSGYTAVAERLDPEAVKTLVERCLGRLGQEVERVEDGSTSTWATT